MKFTIVFNGKAHIIVLGKMTKIFDGHSNLTLFHMSYYATIGALNSEHCGPSYPQNKDTCSMETFESSYLHTMSAIELNTTNQHIQL